MNVQRQNSCNVRVPVLTTKVPPFLTRLRSKSPELIESYSKIFLVGMMARLGSALHLLIALCDFTLCLLRRASHKRLKKKKIEKKEKKKEKGKEKSNSRFEKPG